MPGKTKQSDKIEFQIKVLTLEPGTPEDEALEGQQLQAILDILLDEKRDEGVRKDENCKRL